MLPANCKRRPRPQLGQPRNVPILTANPDAPPQNLPRRSSNLRPPAAKKLVWKAINRVGKLDDVSASLLFFDAADPNAEVTLSQTGIVANRLDLYRPPTQQTESSSMRARSTRRNTARHALRACKQSMRRESTRCTPDQTSSICQALVWR